MYCQGSYNNQTVQPAVNSQRPEEIPGCAMSFTAKNMYSIAATLTALSRTLVCLAVATQFAGCSLDANEGTLTGTPLDHLPKHITVLTDYGMRADFSPDQGQLIFLDDLIGDVHQYDFESKSIRNLTSHYENVGYTRALYLSNGDILLCGAKDRNVDSGNPDEGRYSGKMWVLTKPFDKQPIELDETCWEGPAVSKKGLMLAWARSNIDTHAADAAWQTIKGKSELWYGEITYDDRNVPRITKKRFLLARNKTSLLGLLEPQNFRPPLEKELLFTTYLKGTSDVFGVHLETGKITNYSSSIWYEEAEGISHDGSFIAVEKDYSFALPPQSLDIWKLDLDGSRNSERLTFFNHYKNFGATNPVISNDGKYMAFQIRENKGLIGNGEGILLFDFSKYHLDAVDKTLKY
jgi:hypothetical protein